MKCRRTEDTWCGDTFFIVSMPCSVSTAYSPRRSDSQFSRRTRSAFSIRVIWCESRLLDWSVAEARSLIRIRTSSDSDRFTRIS
ncbi:hypothetical protein GA0115256_14356 [Streptomyces sp. DconLS]|nr:hypothetical protein GA0115256_14356 [Streptomyces sp. DconLS]